MILIQGLDDLIVPPDQSQMMFGALRRRGLPVAYVTSVGEQHGFVKAENNKRALKAELYFYSRIFKVELVDEIVISGSGYTIDLAILFNLQQI